MLFLTLLLSNLIEKHLHFNRFKYTDECVPEKATNDKSSPIVSPWCLALLRHWINTTTKDVHQPSNKRYKRHVNLLGDILARTPSTFSGQKARSRLDPNWPGGGQSRPLFLASGAKPVPYKHINESACIPDENAASQYVKPLNFTTDNQTPTQGTVSTLLINSQLIKTTAVSDVDLDDETPILLTAIVQTVAANEYVQNTQQNVQPTESMVSSRVNIGGQPGFRIDQPPIESIVSSKVNVRCRPGFYVDQPTNYHQFQQHQRNDNDKLQETSDVCEVWP